MWATVINLASKLLPKRRIVRWVSKHIGRTAKARKQKYLSIAAERVKNTPGAIDDATLLVLLQVIDPEHRTKEMTNALKFLVSEIQTFAKSSDSVLDDGLDLIVSEALEL